MKANFFKKMVLLFVVTTFSIFQIQSQTIGSGSLGNSCYAGTAGNYTDTYIGCYSGTSVNANSQYNTFIGALTGYSTTSGYNNTFLGYSSGYTNTTGINNTFLGMFAGYTNTANENTFLGSGSGAYNGTGYNNTFTGFASGAANTSGYQNTTFGNQSFYTNTTGYKNTSLGYRALYNNTIAVGNTAIGNHALYSNTTGGWSANSGANTAVGYNSLYYNSSGNKNCAVGEYALYDNTTGYGNTGIGSWTDVNFSNLTNATAIGNGAVVTASNHVMIGNYAVSEIGGFQSWTDYSDGRFKFNIQENVKGLTFINMLRPITYQLNTQQLDNFIIQNLPDSIKAIHQAGANYADATAIIHSGFIAQEVEQASVITGFTSSIVHAPDNSSDPYGLSYAEIVVPLVKAVQELSQKLDSLTSSANGINKSCILNNTLNVHEIELANNAVLYQNAPNPFGNGTLIKYFVSENSDAQIIFFDEFGNQLKIYKIEEKGMGELKIDANNLSSGVYSYSLILNGKIVDTKKMVRQ